MVNLETKALVVAGFAVGGVIIKKLNDIQTEIKHIERYKSIPTKKDYDARWKRYEEECRKNRED